MSRAVYCSECGRPTAGLVTDEGYRIRVHRRADKPKDPVILCSGWKRTDHLPILLAREQVLAAAMDDEEDIRVGTPDELTIVAGEVHACLGESPDGKQYVLLRIAGPVKSDLHSTEDISAMFSADHIDGIISQLQRLLDHFHKDWN